MNDRCLTDNQKSADIDRKSLNICLHAIGDISRVLLARQSKFYTDIENYQFYYVLKFRLNRFNDRCLTDR